MNTKSN